MSNDFSYYEARKRMVDEQLIARGITAPRVLETMNRVPRHRFVPTELVDEAYADRAATIDCGQTISQPYMVALMTQSLDMNGHERVLEIGTGSGYQTAVLAELAQSVTSIERHSELSRQAGAVLKDLGYVNIRLVEGDGTLGWPSGAPYDRIIVTAAAARVPPPLIEQMAHDGILVIPVGDSSSQALQVIRKARGELQREELSGCRFVPLIGAQDES